MPAQAYLSAGHSSRITRDAASYSINVLDNTSFLPLWCPAGAREQSSRQKRGGNGEAVPGNRFSCNGKTALVVQLGVSLHLSASHPHNHCFRLDVNDVFQNVSFISEFVPMLWGPKKLADLDGWKPHPSATRLLSFNEPNMALQSNITGAEACAYWPTVKKAAATHGLRLGSPAVNHCTGAGNRKKGCFQDTFSWLDDFVSRVRADYIVRTVNASKRCHFAILPAGLQFNQPGCGAETVDFITTHMVSL